jgi:predicted amidohydrolase
MSRIVKIVTVQPPAPVDGSTPDSIQARAMELLGEAAAGVDIVCLPEYLNCMACGPEHLEERSTIAANNLLQKAAVVAEQNGCYVVLPLVIEDKGKKYNRAHLVDRGGKICGVFDKVHLTHVEKDDWGLVPGEAWPVFECDFGRIGVMICYDGCFMEPARVLSLKGAEIIFWPSLQRSFTESELDLQTRAHAYFNHTVVVRSSYGTEKGKPWAPGTMVGFSCICDADGSIAANLGRWAGWTSAVIDLDTKQTGYRSFGGDVGVIKEMRLGDRRPETYGTITKLKV